MKKPLLSVCVITYNHAKYIRECIDSILDQKVDFEWQLIVADDNSTDGTREILQDYKARFPDRIHLILQKKNVGAEQNWSDLLTYPNSKYMLYTEGDDYFIDTNKLQKQIQFLESHPDYALCFHPVRVVFDKKGQDGYVYPTNANAKDFTLDELLNQNYIQTNSAMYRKLDYTKIPKGIIPGDWYLHLMHAKVGKIGFLSDVMSVYRRHAGGTWWGAEDKQGAFWSKYASGHLRLYQEIFKLFPETEHQETITKSLARTVDGFVSLQSDTSTILLAVATDFPELFMKYLKHQKMLITGHEKDIDDRERRIAELYGVVAAHRERIEDLERQLDLILNSRSWKAITAVRSALRR